MAKRKLTRQQAWRISKIQKERIKRADKRKQHSESRVSAAQLGAQQNGQVVAHYGANLDVEDQQGKIHNCLTRSNLPTLVCGDNVVWQKAGDQGGVIVALLPRTSLLSRHTAQERLKPVAANINQIMVISAPKPGIDEDTINRYLAASELTEIKPIVVINKIDLLNASEKHSLDSLVALYCALGYQVIYTSTVEHNGLNELRQALNGKTSIFVGQSGVGKSSLIKTLLPEQNIRIGELSQSSGLGKHTTSVTALYRYNDQYKIIDSPGVREFGLNHTASIKIEAGFIEFQTYLGTCKFSDCKHISEPGCSIINAVNDGHISKKRFESYHRIVQSLSRH